MPTDSGMASLTDHRERKVVGLDDVVQDESHHCCSKGGEQRVSDGVAEDASRVLLQAKVDHRVDDGQADGRHGQQLEQTNVDRGYEVDDLVEQGAGHESQQRTHD